MRLDDLVEILPKHDFVSVDFNKCLELINAADKLLYRWSTELSAVPVIAIFTSKEPDYWICTFDEITDAQQFADKLSLPLEECKKCP